MTWLCKTPPLIKMCFVCSEVHSVPQTYNASPGPGRLCLLPLYLECSFPNCSYDCLWLFLIIEVLFKRQLFKNAYLPPTFSKVASLSYHYHITLLSFFCHMSLSETASLPGICSVNANYQYSYKENTYSHSSRIAENICFK